MDSTKSALIDPFGDAVLRFCFLYRGMVPFETLMFEADICAFKLATLENARNSKQESGIARFDVIQQQDDPTRFVLVEVYRTPDDPAQHKETAHYQKWRNTAANMMAEPRTSITYTNVFPDEQGWD